MEALEALRASALSSVEIVDVLSLLLALPWLVRDAPFYSDIRDMLREELLYELCELEGDSSDDELEPKPEPGVPEAEPEPSHEEGEALRRSPSSRIGRPCVIAKTPELARRRRQPPRCAKKHEEVKFSGSFVGSS